MTSKDGKEGKEGEVHVYTDGACSGNGGSSPLAGVGVFWPEHPDRNVSRLVHSATATNNVAELEAIAEGLDGIRSLQQLAVEKGADALHGTFVLFSDSLYSINALTTWWEKWTAEGAWEGKKNRDLIEAVHAKLVDAMGPDPAKPLVRLQHVRGHAGCVGNNEADALATKAIRTHRSKQGPVLAATSAGPAEGDEGAGAGAGRAKGQGGSRKRMRED